MLSPLRLFSIKLPFKNELIVHVQRLGELQDAQPAPVELGPDGLDVGEVGRVVPPSEADRARDVAVERGGLWRV